MEILLFFIDLLLQLLLYAFIIGVLIVTGVGIIIGGLVFMFDLALKGFKYVGPEHRKED